MIPDELWFRAEKGESWACAAISRDEVVEEQKRRIRRYATRFAAVIVCTCGWRDIARDRVAAWELAALHLRISHVDLAGARRALQAARDARYRQCSRNIKRRTPSAGTGPERRADRATRPPRRTDGPANDPGRSMRTAPSTDR